MTIAPSEVPFQPAKHTCLVWYFSERDKPEGGRRRQPPYQVKCERGCDLGQSQWQDNEDRARNRAQLHEELHI
jgi:hypothetical protein